MLARRCTGAGRSVFSTDHRETKHRLQPIAGPHEPGVETRAAQRLCIRISSRVNPIVVIPARMASTRLPGKPLADINGKPMILHMLDRGREAGIGPVAVACADTAIAEAVRAAGGQAVLTDPALPSGSDRVHAALVQLDPERRHDVVVNLQGDFPTLDPEGLRLVVTPLADPNIDIGTLVVPIRDEAEAATESFVKAACAFRPNQGI